MHIPDDAVEHWRLHGYVAVPLLTPEEVGRALENSLRYFPDADEMEHHPLRYRNLDMSPEFPFSGDALNDIATGADLRSFASRAIGSDDLILTQSLLWAKYPGRGDTEQELHADYVNNSLVVPAAHDAHGQMASILYLVDVTEETGPTYVVSRQHTRDLPLTPAVLARDRHPDVYRHEVPVLAAAGSILLYDMSTFHRGSAFRATRGYRITLHDIYRRAGNEWMGWRSLPRFMWSAEGQHFIERATVEQRNVLGFPKPGSPYWTDETLGGVAARYPGMDMSPYRAAV